MVSPHWLLLLLLVPFTGLLLKLAARVVLRAWAYGVAIKLLIVSWDIGVDTAQLALAGNFHDRLLLVQRKVATEGSLLCWRMLRLAQRARREGMDAHEAEPIISAMEYWRDATIISTDSSFLALTLSKNHPLARWYPKETADFNSQMRRLRRAWDWSQGWLWHARKVTR